MSLQPLYKDSETLLGPDFRPGQHDVICNQRGNDVRDHNHHFRQIIDDHLEVYSQCKTRLDKSILVLALVDMIRERGSPGGGFIKFCHKRMSYVEIGDRCARQKVAHALRKALQTFNESGEKRVKSSTIMQQKKEKGCSSTYALLTSSATSERQRQEPSPVNLLDMFLSTELNAGTCTTTTPHNMLPSQIDDSIDFGGSIEKLEEGWFDELERAFSSNNIAPAKLTNSYGNRVPSSSSSNSLLPVSKTNSECTFQDLAADSFSSESTEDIVWGDLDIESIFHEE